MISKVDGLFVVLLCTLMSACGGGGGGSSSSQNKDTTPPVTPTNSAPTLTLSSYSHSIRERESFNITYDVSDQENDSVSISIENNTNIVDISYDSSTITFVTKDVDEDVTATINVTASDGKSSTSKSFDLTVLNGLKNGSPEISSAIKEIYQPVRNSTEEIQLTFTDPENDEVPIDNLVIDYDLDYLQHVEVNENGWVKITSGHEEVSTDITFTTSDIHGNLSEEYIITVHVGIVEDNTNPSFEFNDVDIENGLQDLEVSVEPFSTNYFTFTIEDAENDTGFACGIDRFESNHQPDNVVFHFDCENRWLEVTTQDIPRNGYMRFHATVYDEHGAKSDPRFVNIRFSENNTEKAKIVYDYVKPFVLLENGKDSILNYTIEDDRPENISFNRIERWYGNENGLTITHVDDHFEITIDENTKSGEAFGFSIIFNDNTRTVTNHLEFKVVAPLTELGRIANKLADKIELLPYTTREYSLLGYSYADFLFNLNLITSNEKEQYDNQFYTDSRIKFSSIGFIPTHLRNKVISGEIDDENQDWLDYYQSLYENTLEDLSSVGQDLIPALNELAKKSDTLPLLTHESELIELENNSLSRFIGNSKYGSWNNDDKWVFNSEYQFINIISNKTQNIQLVK